MDAVTALGLACNVIGLIEVAIKVVNTCRQIHDNGSTEEYLTLSAASTELGNSCAEIQIITQIADQAALSPDEAKLYELASNCHKVAVAIRQELGDVSTSPARSKLKVTTQAVKAFLHKGHIQDLRTKLTSYEQSLNTRMLCFVLKQAISLTNRVPNAEEVTQLKALMEKLDKRLSQDDSTDRRRQELINALTYPCMTAREKTLSDRAEGPSLLGTCDWIFEESAPDREPDPGFVEWLRSTNELFWVVGKPGSGKSTMMHFITSHPMTPRLLSKPATPAPLIATFFFWSGGTVFEKSIQGCLRSIIRKVLSDDAAASTEVMGARGQQIGPEMDNDWSVQKLKLLLRSIVSRTSRQLVIFIDGLDEAIDDEEDLCALIQFLREQLRVKTCISSRPTGSFQAASRPFVAMHIHDYTGKAIRAYVTQKLQHIEPLKVLILEDSTQEDDDGRSSMIEIIVDKAEGVFQWVNVVTKLIIRGANRGDTSEVLLRHLHSQPRDLTEVYSKMWDDYNHDDI